MHLFQNDKKQFEEIYLKYYPILLVYGKTISINEQLIEDTIQELFLKLWQRQENLLIRSSLENYLLVSFRNNLIRKLKTLSTHNLEIDLVDISESNINIEQEKKLETYLNQLPTRQREVIFLRYYKNKSYQEIAEMLDISYQVARNFSYRAIKFLKKNMKNLYSLMLALII
ncbi:MAG: sigma-70 family RNA polymerase sigma factor [Bacteroidetes bacterium]|jgi:RNA polymerase sigma factor (sigma-70 family)|nr:sigma-70 family RNA polymerase sigma factor [Bacteroidota bacterium]MDF1863970.1 sigma-70 family RNA polymerase sigma factor [Saprospiraceae bacterium]